MQRALTCIDLYLLLAGVSYRGDLGSPLESDHVPNTYQAGVHSASAASECHVGGVRPGLLARLQRPVSDSRRFCCPHRCCGHHRCCPRRRCCPPRSRYSASIASPRTADIQTSDGLRLRLSQSRSALSEQCATKMPSPVPLRPLRSIGHAALVVARARQRDALDAIPARNARLGDTTGRVRSARDECHPARGLGERAGDVHRPHGAGRGL